MSEETIIDKVAEYFFDDDFGNTFEKFAEDNCSVFGEGEENKLEYKPIYDQFLALFEAKVEAFLAKEGVTAEQFYEACKKAKEDGDDDQAQIVDLLMATTDFDVFLQIMNDKARLQ